MADGLGFPGSTETARLRLERPTPGDLDELAALVADARIAEEQFPARFRGPAQTEAALHRAIDHWDAHGFGPWLARTRAGDDLVGRIGVMGSELDGRPCVEAKWFVAVDHQGAGYATEAARHALHHGFATLGLREVLAWTMTSNLASQGVMRRLGFTETGTTARAGLPHVVVRMDAEGWAARPTTP